MRSCLCTCSPQCERELVAPVEPSPPSPSASRLSWTLPVPSNAQRAWQPLASPLFQAPCPSLETATPQGRLLVASGGKEWNLSDHNVPSHKAHCDAPRSSPALPPATFPPAMPPVWSKVEKDVRGQLEHLCQDGLSPEELEQARGRARGSLLKAVRKNGSLAGLLCKYQALHGGFPGP